MAESSRASRRHVNTLALAVVAAIAIGSENAAEEQEDHLDALELCLDPFPCRTSPHTG